MRACEKTVTRRVRLRPLLVSYLAATAWDRCAAGSDVLLGAMCCRERCAAGSDVPLSGRLGRRLAGFLRANACLVSPSASASKSSM